MELFTEIKQCSKSKKIGCGKFKILDRFCKDKSTIDGLHTYCKDCQKKYRQENKENISKYHKEYYQENKETISENKKKYNEENKENLLKYQEEYRQENKEEIQAYQKEYYEENKELIQIKNNKYERDRRKNDPGYRFRRNLSRNIRAQLKTINKEKFSGTCLSYIDYTFQQYREHMEALFLINLDHNGKPWMTWDNQGVFILSEYDPNDPTTWKWHQDHITAQSKFDWTNDEDIKKCWALSNLRPMQALDNIKKGNK